MSTVSSRRAILERSLPVLNEIADRYKTGGGDPEDELAAFRYRNSVLYRRISDKLYAIKKRFFVLSAVFLVNVSFPQVFLGFLCCHS